MKYFMIFLFASLITGCSTTGPMDNYSSDLDNLFERYKTFQLHTYPEYATYNGVHDHNDRLTDQSMEAGQRYNDSINGFLADLASIDYDGLSSSQQVNYDLFKYQLNHSVSEDSFGISRFLILNQRYAFHINFPQIIEYQPLSTKFDIENYFSRLEAFPTEADHVIEGLREAIERGIMLPCPVSEQVLDQLSGLAFMEPTASPLYSVVEKGETMQEHSERLEEVITRSITPAYTRLYEFYREEYHPNCRAEVGISNIPGGREYYEYLVKYHTSTNMSPDEVFETGMDEVTRIREAMIETKAELGYGDMELQAFFEHLRTSPEYYYTDKEDLMNGYRAILSEMDEKLPDLFGTLPKTGYDLKEMESYRAVAAPAAYYYPSPDDGSRPGYFYVNTYQLDSRPKYTMTALALHEAVPGHHLQGAIAKEIENVPWFRNQMWVTAFGEGWGLYAEYLGYETEMYDDPIQKMGALSFEMWRACRLVVDVGLHYKDWSREHALNFMKENAPLSELDMNSEIDRYISWPGQALAYKIGELRIKSIRSQAEEALGEKFDIKAFHDVVLENGNIPLMLLEAKVDDWITGMN